MEAYAAIRDVAQLASERGYQKLSSKVTLGWSSSYGRKIGDLCHPPSSSKIN
jgi:hypothetical protein